MTGEPWLGVAVETWRDRRRAGAAHGAACAAATQAVLDAGGTRWQALTVGSALARARPQAQPGPHGIGAGLQPLAPTHRRALWQAAAGEELPVWDAGGRRGRGAFDTPERLAGRGVQAALAACRRPVRTGLDPACGPGAFLLALDQAGVPEILGVDRDPVALAVAAVVVPRATLICADAFSQPIPRADVVVGNPPFVPPERQDKALRRALQQRFPWLSGRFDLAVPFAELAAEATRPGGGLALVLPAPMLVQPYGRPWRRRWVQAHALDRLEGPEAFPGASVHVVLLAATVGAGPAPVPGGVSAEAVLELPASPLDPEVQSADVALWRIVRAGSVPLGSLCVIDTGLVAHGPLGGKARLLHDSAGPGRVPFVDARDLFDGKRRWLRYAPAEMHRPKAPALFEPAKLLVQRLRGGGPVRAMVDRDGLYAGHTLLVAVPREHCGLPPERLLALVSSPLVQAISRIERGPRLDLYPQDLRALPVPRRWIAGETIGLGEAWGLAPAQVLRLSRLAAF